MIFLFYGPNSFAARSKMREMTKRFKNKTGGDLGLEKIDASESTANPKELNGKIISAITSAPMLSASRLVIIEDILSNKPVAEEVLQALDRVPKETVAVFYERKVDERSKLFKELKQRSRAHKFTELPTSALIKWLCEHAQSCGGELDLPTARYLLERVGPDQWRLSNEVTKLVAYSPNITQKNIDALTEPVFEQTAFSLVDVLGRGDAKAALTIYNRLRSAKTEPVLIIGAVAWQMRNLLIAKAAELEQKSIQAVLADFKLSPYAYKKAQGLAKTLSLEQIKTMHALIVEADYQLKSANIDKDSLMESLLLAISEEMLVKAN